MTTIIDNCYGNIFVTDTFGNIIFVNANTAKALRCPKSELMNMTTRDLHDRGLSTRSVSTEVLTRKAAYSAVTLNIDGFELMTYGIPIYDERGEIVMVVNYSQEKETLAAFFHEITQERTISSKYKQALKYLSGNDKAGNSIIAESPAIKAVFRLVSQVAGTNSTILLYGESGTGKEIIARQIYQESLRADEAFIPVNCAAIPRELMESEFFGYTKGAFTGANKEGKPGIFELADNGTLFLDEIGELPLQLQSKLLRVLESGEVTRIGGIASKQTSVRMIAASNRNLIQMVRDKTFREDLYYRLNVVPITIPPLRERVEDIEPLLLHYLGVYNKKYNTDKHFTPEAVQAMLLYGWPGNVRELRNIVERLVITTRSDWIDRNDVPDSSVDLQVTPPHKRSESVPYGYGENLDKATHDFEKRYIRHVIALCDGNVGKAAKQLGIHRSSLYRKLSEKRQ